MSGPPASPEPRPGRRAMAIALLLSGLAGWVDITSFLRWPGLFVTFVSGNTTKTAAAIGSDWGPVAESGGAILVFVAGVFLGELVGPPCGRFGRAVVLALEAALLWAALGGNLAGLGEPVTASALALAMGVQNASVHHADGVDVSITFVTGTLVKVGRGLAQALRGVAPRHAVLPHLGIWLALFGGAILGAAVARLSVSLAILGAAALATALAALALRTALRRMPG